MYSLEVSLLHESCWIRLSKILDVINHPNFELTGSCRLSHVDDIFVEGLFVIGISAHDFDGSRLTESLSNFLSCPSPMISVDISLSEKLLQDLLASEVSLLVLIVLGCQFCHSSWSSCINFLLS